MLFDKAEVLRSFKQPKNKAQINAFTIYASHPSASASENVGTERENVAKIRKMDDVAKKKKKKNQVTFLFSH